MGYTTFSDTPMWYPLVMTNITMERSTIEIVFFPLKHGGSFHSYVNVYQRVYQCISWVVHWGYHSAKLFSFGLEHRSSLGCFCCRWWMRVSQENIDVIQWHSWWGEGLGFGTYKNQSPTDSNISWFDTWFYLSDKGTGGLNQLNIANFAIVFARIVMSESRTCCGAMSLK